MTPTVMVAHVTATAHIMVNSGLAIDTLISDSKGCGWCGLLLSLFDAEGWGWWFDEQHDADEDEDADHEGDLHPVSFH
jgi:hypothetical protein